MKTVGVLLIKFKRENYGEYYGANIEILTSLREYPVKVIGIFVDYELDKTLDLVKEIIDDCDGIILPGGKGHSLIDYDIIKYLYEVDKPTLGICLGMQHMGRIFNGGFIKKISNHRCSSKYAHKVEVLKDSLLYRIIEEKEIMVNSYHDSNLPEGANYAPLKVSAVSEDGNIEAIEDNTKKFFIGVQWHPEFLMDDIYSKKLFEYFISKL